MRHGLQIERQIRHTKKSVEKTTLPLRECDTLSPELAEAVRAIVREELKKDRQHRRRALLAEVDSINRELDIK